MTKFQEAIEKVLRAHGKLEEFNNADHFHLRLEQPHFEPLVIDKPGNKIIVTHYLEMNGDLVPDSDVELGFPSWKPWAMQNQFGHYFNGYDDPGQIQRIHRFCEDIWAPNIIAQRWAERGVMKE